jgi:hypothetical protein
MMMLENLKGLASKNMVQMRYFLITLSVLFLIIALADWEESGKGMVTTALVLNILVVAIPVLLNLGQASAPAQWG